MKRLSRVLLAVGLSLLLVNALWGQGFTTQLTATDGFAAPVTLTVGTAVGASYGIDLAAPYNEFELPPVPPGGIFDVRMVGIPGHVIALKGGVSKDLRGYVYATQCDTFKITFQIGSDAIDAGADSLQLSWSAGLGSVAGGYWHLKGILSSLDIDMTTATSAKIPSENATGFYLIQGDAAAFTTVTYARFWQDNVGGKMKAVKRNLKVAPVLPNVTNLGAEELKATVPLMTCGSDVAVRSVLVKKFGDLLKSAYDAKASASHSKDSIFCLDNYHNKAWKAPAKGQPLAPQMWKKQLTSLAPTPVKGIMQNYLFAQLMTLKFNLKCSELSKTPHGLGSLIIQDGGPFNGLSIDLFAAEADKALSCLTTAGTLQEVTNLCENINKAFNKLNAGVDNLGFDTLDAVAAPGGSWQYALPVPVVKGKPKPVALKAGTLKLAGWVRMTEISWLRTPPQSAPIANPQTALVATPEQYRLDQNYPNPFNPTTNIKFNLMSDGMVTVKVFNLLGQEVATLANQEEMTSGEQEVRFDASALASGVYFYRIAVQDVAGKVMFQDMKKMMLVK